jgi:aspartate/glutamate racemase
VSTQVLVDLITANDRSASLDIWLKKFKKLVRAGADFGLIAANTPHVVFAEVRRVPIPLVSIVATCAAENAHSSDWLCLGRAPCWCILSQGFRAEESSS